MLVIFVAALALATSASASPRSTAWNVSVKVFGAHAPTALCIASAETGGTFSPTAVSPTDDHGLFQIHRGLETYGKRIYNVWFNARIAYRMSRGGTNWSPWTTHGLCGV